MNLHLLMLCVRRVRTLWSRSSRCQLRIVMVMVVGVVVMGVDGDFDSDGWLSTCCPYQTSGMHSCWTARHCRVGIPWVGILWVDDTLSGNILSENTLGGRWVRLMIVIALALEFVKMAHQIEWYVIQSEYLAIHCDELVWCKLTTGAVYFETGVPLLYRWR